MRRTPLSALVLALLTCGVVGSRKPSDDTGPDTTPHGDTGIHARSGVLIHYGHGGVGPSGLDGSLTHEATTELLESRGLAVNHSSVWPESFETIRLAILPAPGTSDITAEFSTLERADLIGVMSAGGVVVVEAEPGTVLNDDILNDLVWDLGGSMHTTGLEVGDVSATVVEHELTAGLGSIGLDLSTSVERNDDDCLLQVDDDCVAVAADSGPGWLVLLADGNVLSDHEAFAAAGHDNQRFLLNLALLDYE